MDIVNILKDKILNCVSDLIEEKTNNISINMNSIVVERPKKQFQGDYSTNVAMILGKSFSSDPRKIGELIKLKLTDKEFIEYI